MYDLILTAVGLGLLYSLVVYGVYLTFRILHFPDLTVDGSLVTGAACTAYAIVVWHVPGLAAVIFGFLGGILAGLIPSFLHVKLKIDKILSGILALSILYTANLRLMGGANISLIAEQNIIPWFISPRNHLHVVMFLGGVALSIKLIVDWFLKTEVGLRIRATGENESTARSLGINTGGAKTLTVILSNGLVGLAGGLLAQMQGFMDINTGIGTIIIGLAALMLGETLVKNSRIPTVTAMILAGSIMYQLVIGFALRMGLAATDIKMVTALIVIAALALRIRYKKLADA